MSHFLAKGKEVYGGIDIFHGVELTPQPATTNPPIPASISFPSALIQVLENDSWKRRQKAKAHAIQL